VIDKGTQTFLAIELEMNTTDIYFIGNIPIPISKDKCPPVARREKRPGRRNDF